MTNRTDPPSTRISAALARIEAATQRLRRLPEQVANDARYDRLRDRTQAALTALDKVIARISAQEAD